MANKIKDIQWPTICVSILLLFIMAGGCRIILDKPCWTLDDDTWIQSRIGMGHPMLMNEAPVYTEDEGRFFPMAYQHNNILLLFQSGSISARSVYCLNAVGWCLFLFLIYLIVRKTLQDKVSVMWANMVASVVIIVLAQRCIRMFSVLWTTLFVDILLAAIISISLYYWARDRKIWALFALILSVGYYAFSIEVNVATPLIIGVCALLPIQRKRVDVQLGLSMLGIVALYVVLYMTLIFPHIQTAYDSTHGTGVSLLANAITMLSGQKLLILIFCVFIWRLYKVFLCKDDFDIFSDTLLSVSVGGIIAAFIMKLNWPEYYLPTIVFAIPSLVSLLDFRTKRNIVVSSMVLLIMLLYFGVKIPKVVKDLSTKREYYSRAINFFDSNCKETPTIAWYQNPNSENVITDKWTYGHLCQHLSQVYMQEDFQPIPYEDVKEDEYILMTPDGVTREMIIENGIVQPEWIQWDEYIMSIHMIKIERRNE